MGSVLALPGLCGFWFDVLLKSDNPENASLWYHSMGRAHSNLKCFVINGCESCDYIGLLPLSARKLVSNHAITLYLYEP